MKQKYTNIRTDFYIKIKHFAIRRKYGKSLEENGHSNVHGIQKKMKKRKYIYIVKRKKNMRVTHHCIS